MKTSQSKSKQLTKILYKIRAKVVDDAHKWIIFKNNSDNTNNKINPSTLGEKVGAEIYKKIMSGKFKKLSEFGSSGGSVSKEEITMHLPTSNVLLNYASGAGKEI